MPRSAEDDLHLLRALDCYTEWFSYDAAGCRVTRIDAAARGLAAPGLDQDERSSEPAVAVLSDTLGSLGAEAMGELIGCTYLRHAAFTSSRLLRNLPVWTQASRCLPQPPSALRFAAQLQAGHIAPGVFVQRISEEVGFGLFAGQPIGENTLIGEYTGEITDAPPPSGGDSCKDTYRLEYPALADRPIYLSAKEYGNVLRCANHGPGDKANAAFQGVTCEDGIVHMAVVTKRDVCSGEQVLIDYGGSFWRGIEDGPIELAAAT